MNTRFWDRRSFLKRTALMGTGVMVGTFGAFAAPVYAKDRSPSEKLNIACVGIRNRGGANVNGVSGENIIALCDTDDNYLEIVGKQFPQAKRFFDYREMLDQMGDKIDGVTVSTTDHTHALVALAAMKRGLNCYCEKPLAHTVEEVRRMVAVAKEKKLVTQMGIQIHAVSNYRRAVEVLRSGAIGKVTDAWIWTSGGRRGIVPPTTKMECPKNIHWDQWLGPAPWREYNSCYLPGIWRSWWDFGSGRYGDMACHLTDLVFWALNLRTPYSIESKGPTDVHPQVTPYEMRTEYLFHPVKPGQCPNFRVPEVSLTPGKCGTVETADPFPIHWSIGGPPEILRQKSVEFGTKIPEWGQAIFFVGTEGAFLVDYGNNILYPEKKYAEYKRPEPSIAPSKGHHAEWLDGIRAGNPVNALCNFEYGAALTETAMLGNISWRAGQQKLLWNSAEMKVTNVPAANALLSKEYRKGWELE